MSIDMTQVNLWMIAVAVFLGWALALSAVKKIVFAIIRQLTAKTENKIDDLLLEALDFPVQIIVYASGVLVVEHFVTRAASPEIMNYLLAGFKIGCIVAGVLFVDKFMGGLIRMYAEKVEILKTSGGVARGFVRVVVMGLGALTLLDTMGVSITPIIASLGIGSLAVALALQPTLENFFSGIQIIADKPIQVGQFIRLESGEEGTVTRIGWRSTWICLPNNNTVVIPNKILGNTRVLNYFYPDAEVVFTVPVGVHYQSDLEKVERVAIEVARQVLKSSPGGVAGFDPCVRYYAFEESSINFNVVLRAKDWPSIGLVKHEFIKQLQKRFAVEGISMPYPTRTLIQEK